MEFNLSDFGKTMVQPLGKPNVEKIMLDGEVMKAFVFPGRTLMSPGTWNGWHYSQMELAKAYNNTDWTDQKKLDLYADHEDRSTKSWIGQIRNPRLDGEHLVGDLVVVDDDYVKKLMYGAKFGISPKLFGKGRSGSVVDASYENFSVVTVPACKTTFLNSEDEEKPEAAEQEVVDTTPEDLDSTNEVKMAVKDEKPKSEDIEAKLEAEDKPKTEDRSEAILAKLSELSEGIKANQDKLQALEDSKAAQVEDDKEEPDEPEDLEEPEGPTEVDGEPIRKTLRDSEVSPAPEGSFVNADIGMVKYLSSMDGAQETVQLELKESTEMPWMTFELASTVSAASHTRGSAISSGYLLQPIAWAKSLVDGGKNNLFLTNVLRQATIPDGVRDFVMPYRKKYEDTWESSSEEFAAGSEISMTVLNDMEGIQFTPTRYNYKLGITNKTLRSNAIDLIRYAREELAYKWANDVDVAVGAALSGATAAADDTPGLLEVYGGDATSDATIEAGDVLDTDMVAKAKRLLKSKYNYYWTGGVFTKDDALKNPWEPTTSEPVVFFIAPEQEEQFLTDSQFVNAAEYGNNSVVINGELGSYLGIKIVSTNNVPSSDTLGAGGNISGHKCLMVKSQRCGGIAWAQKPEIKAYDWPEADQKRITMSFEYAINPIHGDAIVELTVADV